MVAPISNMAAPMAKACKPSWHLNANPNALLPGYSSSSGENSSSSESEESPPYPLTPKNPWDKIQKAAIKEGDWQIASKFTAFPVRHLGGGS